MRKSRAQLYAPFIALALAQAAFVVWAPSDGETQDPLAGLQVNAGAPGSSSAGVVSGSTGTGAGGVGGTTGSVPGSTGGVGGSTAGGAGTTGTGAGGTGGGGATGVPGAATGGGGGGGGTTAPGAAPAGDTSHCTGNLQTDLIATAPACTPAFTGDNGGATYPGVSGEAVTFMRFSCLPNEQVNAILQTQGLAATEEETDAMIEATITWMEANYEFYGREIVYERFIGDCPLSPPDPALSRQAATEAAARQPMFVYVQSGGAAAQDVFAQAGIINLGGTGQTNEFFAGRRPFRWDLFPTGTESADWLAEYYCKKLAGKNASHAGALIHPSIGGRNTPRKPGILGFDNGDGTTVPYLERARDLLEQCTGQSVPIIYYESDINRAAEQTRAVTAKLISEKVTTLVCFCDPIAPTFLTVGLTQNNYFPEHLLSGMYLTDYDVLGRLYDPTQWRHAFGPSQLANQPPFEQTNAAKIWRASGREGVPCSACNLITGYMTFLGSMIQYAGPNLNPLTVEQGLVGNQVAQGGWEATGGNPFDYFIKFGPDDYTAISDFREVYWDGGANSAIDGKKGAYIALNGGRRYTGGQLDGSFDIPATAS